MAEYKKLVGIPPEEISKISELFEKLKTGLDTLYNTVKVNIELAKAQAGDANLQMLALLKVLDEIILEIEKLKRGTFSNILAHPYAHGIKANYDRDTDTMTLSATSALEQVKEAFDDEGDKLAPDKFNKYGGLVIVGAVPGLVEFFSVLDSVGKFFSEQELIDLKEQIEERWEEKEKKVVKLPTGIDFFGTSIAEQFPAYVALLNKVQSYPEAVKSGIISASENLNDLIDFADDKLSEAEDIIGGIKDFLDKFKSEISEAGVYYKTFKSKKADDIKEELLEGMPDSWSTSKYSLVFGIFGKSEPIELVFKILSLD